MDAELYHLILLNAGHAVHHSDWNYERIRSSFARFYYVTQGEAFVTLDSGKHRLLPGYIYLIPAFTTHTDECFGVFELYYLHVFHLNNHLNNLFERFYFPIGVQALPIDRLLFERLLELHPNLELRKYDPELYDNSPTRSEVLSGRGEISFFKSLETQGIIQQLLSRFLKKATPRVFTNDQRILLTLEFIAHHIESKIDIGQLAHHCSLSTDHFIRLFRREMNCTPLVYIHEKKMERAQSLLLFTSQTVKDIAYQLSFENVSYFNKLFKKHTGYTPTLYRAMI